MQIGIVIPACNEAESVAEAVATCCSIGLRDDLVRVVVCDNASTDGTVSIAQDAGAEVVCEEQRGYGAACQTAIGYLADWPEVLLFCDADSSPTKAELQGLLAPIRGGSAEFVIGVRKNAQPGSMTVPQRFGNALAVFLIRLLWGRRFHDLGPTRAISRQSLELMSMQDRTWGWTVEMQIKAVQFNIRTAEVAVEWRRRKFGQSKISGTVSGVVRAGCKILWTVLRLYLVRSQPAREPVTEMVAK